MTSSVWQRHRSTLEAYGFLAPFLAAYLLFLVYPFLKGVWISLHEWNLLAVTFNPAAKTLVGAQNFVDILTGDRRFWQIVGNTVLFVLLTVPAVTVIAMGLAIMMNRETKAMAVFRTLFFLSQVLSVTVVTLIWQMMYSPRQGLIANLLALLGLEPIEWVTSPMLAMPAIVIATVWWSLGFALVVFLAGLQEIPGELYEAARLDGAGHVAVLRHIIIPGLRRTTTFVVVMQIVLHFQVFGQSHLITGGGPNDRTQVLVRYIYQTAFRDSEVGYASALAICLFALMLVFSILQLRLNRSTP